MSGGEVLVAGLAALAILLAAPRAAVRRLRPDALPGVSRRRLAGATAATVAVAASAAPGVSAVGALALVLAAAGLIVVARAMVRAHRGRTQRRRRRGEVIAVCDALVAELRAGLPAERAVANACQAWPELVGVVATARLGGDVGAALSKAAEKPGAEGLRLVAAGWQVSGRSGAGLAAVLDRVAGALRADEDAHAEVLAALGPPRATAKLLASLPIIGLGLGTAMGVDPLGFLLTTPVGNACLGVGASLATLGVWWVERLADAVEA